TLRSTAALLLPHVESAGQRAAVVGLIERYIGQRLGERWCALRSKPAPDQQRKKRGIQDQRYRTLGDCKQLGSIRGSADVPQPKHGEIVHATYHQRCPPRPVRLEPGIKGYERKDAAKAPVQKAIGPITEPGKQETGAKPDPSHTGCLRKLRPTLFVPRRVFFP